jgi:uncharacterized protein YdhG (YjbR/CyaY superfamily)
MNEVDQYIATFPLETQEILNKIRAIIKTVAPDAVEGFNYRMPSYKLNKKPIPYDLIQRIVEFRTTQSN